MSMDRLKSMKERAMCLAEQGLNRGVEEIDAKELGEVIDIVKDLEEACYYSSIVEAMKKTDEEEKYMEKYLPEMAYARNYGPYYRNYPMMNEMPDRMFYRMGRGGRPRMNYSGGNYGNGNQSGNYSGSNGNGRNYYEPWHDEMYGRSWETRRNYMEGKEHNISESTSMENLEEYAKDLTEDLMELVENATPNEKEVLRQKLNTLASKIV